MSTFYLLSFIFHVMTFKKGFKNSIRITFFFKKNIFNYVNFIMRYLLVQFVQWLNKPRSKQNSTILCSKTWQA